MHNFYQRILLYNYRRISGSIVASFGQNNFKNCNFKQFQAKNAKILAKIFPAEQFCIQKCENSIKLHYWLAIFNISEGFIVSFRQKVLKTAIFKFSVKILKSGGGIS